MNKNNISEKYKNIWVKIGIYSAIMTIIVLVLSGFYSNITEIKWPDTGWITVLIILVLIGAVSSGVVHTIVWMNNLGKKNADKDIKPKTSSQSI